MSTQRHRFMLALRTAADHGGKVTVSPEEAGILIELLRTGEPQTQQNWAHEQLRIAFGMLASFDGDTLEDRMETVLGRLTQLERWQRHALGILLDVRRILGDVAQDLAPTPEELDPTLASEEPGT